MKKWSAIGMLCFLGAASPANAGQLQCHAPQLVREDQGIGAFQDVPAAGGTFVMLVWGGSKELCGMAVTESSDFVEVKSSVADRVTYTVQPNTGVARVASFTGKSGTETSTFEIRQAGVPGAVAPTPTPKPVDPNALSNDLNVLGAARTCGTVPVSVIKSGAVLAPDTWVLSPSRQFKLIFQTDGNLVLYGANNKFIWNNGKLAPGGTVTMQTDGNLVSYDKAKKAIWATGTNGKAGSFLAVQDDGKVIVYSAESCQTTVAHWSAR